MNHTQITGLGYYVPEQIVTNEALTQRVNTTDEWIQERSGIKERRFADLSQETNYGMAAKASRKALAQAGIAADDLDMIIYATLSPDYVFPGNGVLLQRELGCKEIPALDLRAQCSGFVYGLSIADQFIKTGHCQKILLVGSEIHSSGLDFSDHGRHISVLFGDGAGAAVLQAIDEEKGVLVTKMYSDGKHAEDLALIDPGFSKQDRITAEMFEPGGSGYPVMNGQFVFKNAIKRMPEVTLEALQTVGLEVSDIDLLICHQANLRIAQMVQKSLQLPDEKVYNNIHKYGNTTAASIPIALTEAYEMGKVKPGNLVALAAFGSGFTWASALIRW